MPNAPWAAITVAPVCPALKSAAASPPATSSAATRIDARGLRRSAAAGASAIPMTSGASTIRCRARGRRDAGRSAASSAGRAPDQREPEIEVPRRRQRAVDDRPRRVVAAHRVDGDADHGAEAAYSSSTARTCRRVVVAAVRADAVRRFGSWHCGQGPVVAAVSASCVRRLAVRVLECRRFGFGMCL